MDNRSTLKAEAIRLLSNLFEYQKGEGDAEGRYVSTQGKEGGTWDVMLSPDIPF